MRPSSDEQEQEPFGHAASALHLARVRARLEARRGMSVRQLPPRLIQSRLRPPRPLLATVRREELVERLSVAEAPLVVLAAPGGYGKTVTLTQWVESDGVPFAWLQADTADNDPLLFLQYLKAALDDVIDIDPLVAQWLQMAPPPVETRILPALAAAVAGAAPFVLVIDDVHLLTDEACWHVLGLLIDQLPAGAHVCLSGRMSPVLPLARLRAAGRLLEVGPAELSLSSAETLALLDLHGVAGDAAVASSLTEATEGWVAGVSLAALAGEHSPADDVLAGIRGDRREIARYLATEVLGQQPADVARFLVQTSILERLSPGLCRAVTGDEAAGRLLRTVAHGHLFISALDDTGEWFRYHHLFAEFLQAESLRRFGEEEAAALHRRAAAWFEEHDDLEEAVRHWLAGGDAGRAGAIVCRCHMHYAHLARYQTLCRWLDMFTDEQIFADPALTIAAGWIGPMAGDSPRARAWLGAAFRARVADDEMWPDAPVPLRAMQAGLVAAIAPEGVRQMLVNAQVAVGLSDDAPPGERSAVILLLGAAHWLSGDDDAALRYLRQGEVEGEVANVLAYVAAVGYQALICADAGRWDEARRLTGVALGRIEEAGLSWGVPVYPAVMARVRLQTHDGDEGVAESLSVLEGMIGGGSAASVMVLLGDVILGEVSLERGDISGATHWLQKGLALLEAMPDAGILRERLRRLRERLEERRLAEPLTPAEKRVLELLPTELNQREIAERLFVSRETVRTHTRDIYRKLDVHTRSEAVARAREVGLLRPV